MPDKKEGEQRQGQWQRGTWETGEGLEENQECGELLPTNKTVAQVGGSTNYSWSNIGSVLHMKSSWAKSSKSAWKEGKPAFASPWLACHNGKEQKVYFGSLDATSDSPHAGLQHYYSTIKPILGLMAKDSSPCKITWNLELSTPTHTCCRILTHGIRSLKLCCNPTRSAGSSALIKCFNKLQMMVHWMWADFSRSTWCLRGGEGRGGHMHLETHAISGWRSVGQPWNQAPQVRPMCKAKILLPWPTNLGFWNMCGLRINSI